MQEEAETTPRRADARPTATPGRRGSSKVRRAAAAAWAATLGLTNGPVDDAAGAWGGSFQSLWRRQADGSWRVIFDGAPSREPPAEGAAAP